VRRQGRQPGSIGPGLGKGGTGVLSVDGQEVAKNTLDHTTPITFRRTKPSTLDWTLAPGS
jgi:hypothetical protein